MSFNFDCYGLDVTIERLEVTKYQTGATAVIAHGFIHDEEAPEPFRQVVSMNVPGESENLGDDFAAKNYSEGEPLFKALIDNLWIMATRGVVQSGFVQMPVCTIGEAATVEVS